MGWRHVKGGADGHVRGYPTGTAACRAGRLLRPLQSVSKSLAIESAPRRCHPLLPSSPAGGGMGTPAWIGCLCAACNPDMTAYAWLEVMAVLPSQLVAKLQQPPMVKRDDIQGAAGMSQDGPEHGVWVIPYAQHVLDSFHLVCHNQQQRQTLHIGMLWRQA